MTTANMLGGVRGRVAALAALIALLATAACAALAAQALVKGLHGQREQAVMAVAQQGRSRLNWLVQRLAMENAGRAASGELTQRMPHPPEAWARANLMPGSSPGRLVHVVILITDGAVTARFRRSSSFGPEASPDDPAPPTDLASLALPDAQAGLAVPGGFPVLFACNPVAWNDGRAGPRCSLLSLTYLTASLQPDLVQEGYDLEMAPIPRPASGVQAAWREGRVAATVSVPTHDGHGLAITVVELATGDGDLVWRAVIAVIAGGVASAAAAILIGVVVGWTWMRPFTALAEACRRRVEDPGVPLPTSGGIQEAEVLRDALERLSAAERTNARRIGDALDRERTVNAVHQRFLTQLGHEIGDPLHAIVATLQRLAAEGGRLPPEEVAAAVERALELESRLQEALGLVGFESGAIRSEPGVRDIESYLGGIADLMRSLAASRGGSVVCSGAGRAMLRPELLTPILINLVANALRAGRGVCVSIEGRVTNDGSWWRVADDGVGIEPELADRIADACVRGEVLPGSVGLGLGLAVVLANLRALGGRIGLDNRPGEGAEFTIDLPNAVIGSSVLPALRG